MAVKKHSCIQQRGPLSGAALSFLQGTQSIAPASVQNPASLTARQVKGYRVDLREIQLISLNWPQLIGNSPFPRIEQEPASCECVAEEGGWTEWSTFTAQHNAADDPVS